MQSEGFTMRAFYRTAFFATAVIVGSLLVGVCLAKMARADGYAGYKDERPTHPVFQHRNSSGNLRRYLTAEEKRILKRIHRDASARRAQGTRPNHIAYQRFSPEKRLRSTRVERVYIAEPRRRHIEPIRYERDTRECRAPISVEGRPRGTYGRASESAYNAWENSARARHGYAFGNRSNARGDAPDCNPVRNTFIGTKVWVCSFVARPCRDL
jgi:hypothetical protein